MPWRDAPIPIGLPTEDMVQHVMTLAPDPPERGRYSIIEIYTGTSVMLIDDPVRAMDHWRQSERTAADLLHLTTGH